MTRYLILLVGIYAGWSNTRRVKNAACKISNYRRCVAMPSGKFISSRLSRPSDFFNNSWTPAKYKSLISTVVPIAPAFFLSRFSDNLFFNSSDDELIDGWLREFQSSYRVSRDFRYLQVHSPQIPLSLFSRGIAPLCCVNTVFLCYVFPATLNRRMSRLPAKNCTQT